MYTGIWDLLCVPTRELSVAHRACQGGCVVPPCPPYCSVMPTEQDGLPRSQLGFGPSALRRH